MNTTKKEFWKGKTYALFGVSLNKRKFGNTIYKEMKKRGYNVFPVNKNLTTYDRVKCFSFLKDIPEKLDGVVICAKPEKAVSLMQESVDLGIKRVWLQQGSQSAEAIKLGQGKDMVIHFRSCALLYLEPVKFPHSVHRWLAKVLGKLD
jgi:hypothetical protein